MLRVNYMRPEQMPAASPGLSSKRVIRTARRRRFPSAGPDGGLVSRGDFRGILLLGYLTALERPRTTTAAAGVTLSK
jgi:hypothetical protein